MDKEKSTKGLEMKYFILKPRGDTPYAKASRKAMRIYANWIRDENPVLANELQEWAEKEEEAIKGKSFGGCGCGHCDT